MSTYRLLLACLLLAARAPASAAGGDPVIAEVISDVTTVTATGPGAYTRERILEVRVYNASAASRFRNVRAYRDDQTKITVLEGSVQGRGDKKPTRSRKRDAKDYAAYDGYSLAISGGSRVVELPLPSGYPAVYRHHVVTEVAEDIAIPPAIWDYGSGVAVTRAELQLRGAVEEIRHLVVDALGVVAEEALPGGGVRFAVSDLPAREAEDFAPGTTVAGPAVLLAPRRGRMEGVEGDFDTWAGVGAWTAGLVAERSDLPAEAAAEVRALVADVADPLERIRLVYAYMQARTHYVSIQLGIGGFQPMPPSEVHANGYGDCKALTNYTRLLLAEADVESYYCELGVANREITSVDFPSAYMTNHVMLAVPLAATAAEPADTVWLECTSQTLPAGLPGRSGWAAGRRALLIKDGLGHLVRVACGAPEDNLTASRTEIALAPDGSAHLQRATHYTGIAVEVPFTYTQVDARGRRKLARGRFAVTADGLAAEASVDYARGHPVGTTRESARLPGLARRVGDRLVVPALGYLPAPAAPSDTADRLRPFAFDDAHRRVDTVHYVLPEGHLLTAAPEPIELRAPHATYRLAVDPQTDGSLLLVREFEVRRGVYPATDAAAIGRFYAAVRRADAGVLATAHAEPTVAEPR